MNQVTTQFQVPLLMTSLPNMRSRTGVLVGVAKTKLTRYMWIVLVDSSFNVVIMAHAIRPVSHFIPHAIYLFRI